MSTDYIKSYFVLANSQISKIKSAIRNGIDATIQVQRGYVVNKAASNVTLNLTKRQVNKITSIPTSDPYKGFRIHLSKTQLQNQSFFEDRLNPKIRKVDFGDTSSDEPMEEIDKIGEQLSKKVKELSLSVTPAQKAIINTEIVKLMTLRDMTEKDFQSGEGLGALLKLAIPFIKTVLPKIVSALGTIGVAAAGGAASGAAHKATSGKGFKRTGGTILFRQNNLAKLMRIGNILENNNLLNRRFGIKMNEDIKKQSGGFIGTLLAGLAGSLLPMLLGGKGFKRAGSKD